jgi:hypothetical protein
VSENNHPGKRVVSPHASGLYDIHRIHSHLRLEVSGGMPGLVTPMDFAGTETASSHVLVLLELELALEVLSASEEAKTRGGKTGFEASLC